MNTKRQLANFYPGYETSDGAGVNLLRLLGTPAIDMLDPFLMLDFIHSDNPDDYIAGFPSHPHRGFETVTYLFNGKMKHKDNAGHEGVINSGGVQWMTAGRGIIHSETPQQSNGLLSGIQLWVNLPKEHKMMTPRYQELEPDEVPEEDLKDNGKVRVIAGKSATGISGPIKDLKTDISLLDIQLYKNGEYQLNITDNFNVFIYTHQGQFEIIAGNETTILPKDGINVLTSGNIIHLKGLEEDNRLLLFAGKPINEPVVKHGPFVMNSKDEIRQAINDFQSGNF